MPTQARSGYKAFLYRDNGSGTFVKVAEVRDITGPALTAGTAEATNMDSTDGWEEHIATGVKAAGDVTFQMNLLQDDATQNVLYSDLAAGTLSNYQIVFRSGTKRLQGAALVTSIGHAFPMKDVMVNDVTLKPSGKWERVNHP